MEEAKARKLVTIVKEKEIGPSSDNPDKAIISLKNDRETDYKVYISVQNELVAAYNELRDREFIDLYPNERMSFVEAYKKYSDPRTSPKS